MKYYPVSMIHEHIKDCKADLRLPKGYFFREFQKGDKYAWAELETAAGEFKTREGALERFEREFGNDIKELETRCFFLCTETQKIIGTAMGWYNKDFRQEEHGRLHWISIHPEYQGRGLSKPLIARAIRRIQESHEKAYLTTQTTSWKAIKVYLDFGFVPLLSTDDCRKAWRILAGKVGHPALECYLSKR